MTGEEERLDGGTYSELLFGDDDDGLGGCFSFTSSSPKMLCFGTDTDTPMLENCSVQTPEAKTQKSGVTCSGDSPSACSSNNISKPNKSNNKKRNGAEKQSDEKTKAVAAGNQRNCKRTKMVENLNVTPHAKVKKAKLGERITALQQLVSPFGKTDTASVLHEAMGYIRFLHDQVQVLCSPYLQRQHLSPSLRVSTSILTIFTFSFYPFHFTKKSSLLIYHYYLVVASTSKGGMIRYSLRIIWLLRT
ncbi:hypothetical protein T459_32197 [Capsicum annuum]|uniref:BHLH domain-containing protein n=1 Tax=Capsicum annuum TaxID=4072 RepID=A0A2G2Y2F8_CAPAN|nr:hypothetical protein T459_32197 [Capsicum annuum]